MGNYDFGLRGPRETIDPRYHEGGGRGPNPEHRRSGGGPRDSDLGRPVGREGSELTEDEIRASEKAGYAQDEFSRRSGGGFWDHRANRRGRNPDQI